MPKFVIEREIPGIEKFSEAEIKAISEKSRNVLREMGPSVQWIHSFVTDDKVYCVYLAPGEEPFASTRARAGLPVDRISAVRQILDPANY